MRFCMKQHERDYFVSRIRNGKYRIQIFKQELEILSPTIEDEYYINKAYMDGMESSLDEGFKTNEEMVFWMVEKNLWSYNEDADLKMYQQKVKDLKIDIYNARNSIKSRERVRSEIRNTELEVSKLNQKKSAYYNNTCEGIATVEKISEFLKRCTFCKGELYDFEELPVDLVSSKYYSLFLAEQQIRELARNEPWRTIWSLNDTNSVSLFNNGGRELSHDQKNIMVWSKMYDNVQESMDCPQDDIIKDDDMLDGWLLVQGKKRDEERSKSEVDNLNPKVAGAQEVYLMANSKQDRRRIDSLNSFESSVIKKQREQVIKSKGSASQLDFADEKLKAQRMQTEGMRNQFRR